MSMDVTLIRPLSVPCWQDLIPKSSSGHTQRQSPMSAPHGCVACPGKGPWGARTLSLANLTRCLAHLAFQRRLHVAAPFLSSGWC